MKPTQSNPDGGIVEKEAKIDASNVALYDEKAKEAGRIGVKVSVDENGKKTKSPLLQEERQRTERKEVGG